MENEEIVNDETILDDFKQSRVQFLHLCNKRNLLNGDIGFLKRWWKNTRKNIDQIDRELAVEYESLGWRSIKEVEFPKFITEYRAGHPGLKRLGWEIVCKVEKHEKEFEEANILNRSLTEEWQHTGNTLNQLEAKLNETIGHTPTDTQLGIQGVL